MMRLGRAMVDKWGWGRLVAERLVVMEREFEAEITQTTLLLFVDGCIWRMSTLVTIPGQARVCYQAQEGKAHRHSFNLLA